MTEVTRVGFVSPVWIPGKLSLHSEAVAEPHLSIRHNDLFVFLTSTAVTSRVPMSNVAYIIGHPNAQ